MKKVHNYKYRGVSANLLLSKFFINSINAEKFPTLHVDLLLSELFPIFVRKEMAMMMKGMMMVMRKVRMRTRQRRASSCFIKMEMHLEKDSLVSQQVSRRDLFNSSIRSCFFVCVGDGNEVIHLCETSKREL